MQAIRAAAHSIAASVAALRDAERASGQLLAGLGLAGAPPAARVLACGAGGGSCGPADPLDVRLAAAVAALQSRLKVPQQRADWTTAV